jgi:hemerythrin-like metal-binding protein
MDRKYIIGIPEIDAQHQQIGIMVESLKEVISARDQRHLIDPTLRRLHQQLITHFAYEEAFMAMVNYADLSQHRKNHKGLLKLFDDYFANPPVSPDHDCLGKLLSDKILGYVADHDTQMTTSVRQYLSTLSTPALNVPAKK